MTTGNWDRNTEWKVGSCPEIQNEKEEAGVKTQKEKKNRNTEWQGGSWLETKNEKKEYGEETQKGK